MTKNILAFVFSGRKTGNTAIVMNTLLRPLQGSDIQVDLIQAASLDIKPCLGCFGCNNGDLKCVLKDDLEMIKEKIIRADALVVASPSYITSAPGMIKNIMDRCAAWGLNTIENGAAPKIGVAISVAGATSDWYALQRVLPSLFLKLYNCRVMYQRVFGGVAIKGEVLLYPEVLNEVTRVGECLNKALHGEAVDFPASDQAGELVCPNCRSNVFKIIKRGCYECAVCGIQMKPRGLFGSTYALGGNDKFTSVGAQEHSEYIGQKINHGMQAADEIRQRSLRFFEEGILPKDGFSAPSEVGAPGAVVWEADGQAAFEQQVPAAFQRFVKTAVEKKALARGETHITREVFLKIKRDSGN